MKRFLLPTILVLTAGHAAATVVEAPTALPKATPLKLEHNAGQLEPGPRYDYTFPIRNDGKAPLEIRKAVSDCMCVDPSFDPVIAPGQTGSVRIRFDTKGRIGLMRKHVTVETNDPAQPSFVLTLNAMLRLPVEVSPDEEVMLPLTRGGATELELTLHATRGRTLTLGPIRSTHPQLRLRVLPRAEVEERIAVDLARTQIVLVTVPPALSSKAFDATLRIPTNNPKRPLIQVRIHAYPQAAVAALPPRLYLGTVKEAMDKPLFVVLTLQRRQGPFKVLGTEATDKNLRLQVSMERPDHWEVVAVYDGGWPKGIHEGVITIRTDDPQRPVVKVPYRAEVS